jgi:hypothetical protein|tara:strand:- start:235 stop:621 length:387 start_codon:yes stop_codon:yes gene_type:complete
MKSITKYEPSMCDTVIELGKTGASQKIMYSTLGISKTTGDRWKKEKPEFAEAMDRAVVESQAWWEREALANLNNRTYNTRLFEVVTRAQFPADYKERMEIKQDIKQEVQIDFAGEVSSLIKQLRETKL